MSRTKLFLLSAVTLFAVGMLASATAHAEFTEAVGKPKCESPGIPNICLTETLILAAGEEGFSAKESKEFLLEVPSLELKIVCTKFELPGKLEQSANQLVNAVLFMKTVLELKECKIVPPFEANCKVKLPVHTVNLDGEVLTITEKEGDVNFKPETGTLWMTLTIESKTGQVCPATLVGAHNLTGEQLCILKNPEKPGFTEVIECPEAGSGGLHFAEKAAHMEFAVTMFLNNYKEKFDWANY